MQTEDATEYLKYHRKVWQNKPALKNIYHNYYRMIKNACIIGNTLEIGGGSGNFKEFFPGIISTDIVILPWLDLISDAQILPFRNESVSNIVMIDVLHHLEYTPDFFNEVERILEPGGRLILLEPAITPGSWFFLSLFHPEPINLRQDPYKKSLPADPAREPFDANQAIPTLLFFRNRQKFFKVFPSLKLIELCYHDLFAYPLSGGFRAWCFIPKSLIKPLLSIEQRLLPFLGPLMSFRLFCVVEKKVDFFDYKD